MLFINLRSKDDMKLSCEFPSVLSSIGGDTDSIFTHSSRDLSSIGGDTDSIFTHSSRDSSVVPSPSSGTSPLFPSAVPSSSSSIDFFSSSVPSSSGTSPLFPSAVPSSSSSIDFFSSSVPSSLFPTAVPSSSVVPSLSGTSPLFPTASVSLNRVVSKE